MNPQRKIPLLRLASRVALVAVLVGAGCDLAVTNPNQPDAPRAFQDPAGLEQLLGGAFRTWVIIRGDYFVMAPNAQADNYTASWNNAALRYYSSAGVDCPPSRCGWLNTSSGLDVGLAVESPWYGYYTILSSANDVLAAIANDVCFDDDCTADNTLTSRNTAIAKMLQGMALGGLALWYDKAFKVDETTDLSNPSALDFTQREEMRDFALQKFEEAHTEAGNGPWLTPPEWMGVGAGTAYNNSQIQKVIRTMQAELLAMYPRDATENAAVNWTQVATYASEGISEPAPGFNFEFYVDAGGSQCGDLDCIKVWGNSMGTMRVDTRVASILATNHQHPWPVPGGNPCPIWTTATGPIGGVYGVDARVGDGTYGPSDDFSGLGSFAATANAGTDFACATTAIFRPDRGQYHQSNLQHIRYERLAYQGEGLPTSDGTGQDPFYTPQMNDLLWAEGLIRSGQGAAGAAKINNSRVGRGGLPALTGGESQDELLAALQYEQEIEFMGQGSTPFFNRRRVDGLDGCSDNYPGFPGTCGGTAGGTPSAYSGTPRQMPIPAKEMEVLVREVYTFGGPGCGGGDECQASVVATGGGRTDYVRIRSVGEIWADIQARARSEATRKR